MVLSTPHKGRRFRVIRTSSMRHPSIRPDLVPSQDGCQLASGRRAVACASAEEDLCHRADRLAVLILQPLEVWSYSCQSVETPANTRRSTSR